MTDAPTTATLLGRVGAMGAAELDKLQAALDRCRDQPAGHDGVPQLA